MIGKKGNALIILAVVVLLAVGVYYAYNMVSTKSIAEIKSEDYIGKSVRISGTVESAIKLGQFSGYTLSDDSDSIFVSSSKLPEEGSKVSVTGVVMKEIIIGYYLKAD
ncbi:MAG: hypothetical protein Q8L29_01400 [archaeon]|nr:hypothetical protein [archaeon]